MTDTKKPKQARQTVRPHTLNVRLSFSEKRALERAAKAAKQKPSAFARQLIADALAARQESREPGPVSL